jgi:predicted ATPase with chaperone activity
MDTIKAYRLGREDADVLAALLSPSELKQRLSSVFNGDPAWQPRDPYMAGFVGRLRDLDVPNRPGVRRGQGGACTGLLRVRLVGPAGCGKSLVAGILRCLLPLLPLERFVVEEHVDD